jgi:hypothetical protein
MKKATKAYQPKKQRISKMKRESLKLSKNFPEASKFNKLDAPQSKIVSLETEEYGFNTMNNQKALLPGAFSKYSHACVCGIRYENNCAHFLSNAFMLQDPNINFPSGYEKCASGRLIRAKELLDWFRSLNPGFKQNHTGINDFYWFVYQENAGQGHVCIHYDKTGKFDYKGTTNLPTWPVQWHYLY